MALSRRDFLEGTVAISLSVGCDPFALLIRIAEHQAPLGTEQRKFKELDPKRIREIAALLPVHPKGFGSPITDRGAWDVIAKRRELASPLKEAEKFLVMPIPAWKEEAYLEFSKSGRRGEGQDMMSSRFKFLPALVWAECCENKGRFVSKINELLQELAKQPAWCLPAHDGKLEYYRGEAKFVDLVVALYAHEIAQSLYLLEDRVTPETRAIVLRAMERFVFAPIRRTYEVGTGHWWLYNTANWNSVCLSGVTGAALALIKDKSERAKFAAAAEYYAINGVVGFGDDGYCGEGMSYYNYGFGHYILLRELLWQQTSGKIDMFAPRKIQSIATFGPRLEMLPGTWPAFADCPIGAKVASEMLWYCSRVLGLGIEPYHSSRVLSWSQLARGVMHAFPNSTEQPPKQVKGFEPVGLRSLFDNSGVLSCRVKKGSTCRIGASFKGGHNDEPHNHNDLGSYAIVIDDVQVTGDAGGPTLYTGQMFGPERYKHKILNSFGHPVPLIDNTQQRPGRDAVAKILSTKFSDTEDHFILDLTSAYPVKGLQSIVREFAYERTGRGRLLITDRFELDREVTFEVGLITHGTWKLVESHAIELVHKGKKMIVRALTSEPILVKSEVIDENAPKFSRIAIALSSRVAKGELTLSFEPAM